MKKLLTPIKNLLNWIDNPKSFLKIFQVLFYYLPAALICVSPILFITQGMPPAALLYGIPLVILLACILIIRAKELLETSDVNKTFFIIPAIGHYLKTSFEIYASFIFLLPLGMIIPGLALDEAGLVPPFITSQPLLVIPLFTTVSAYFILFIGKYISELFISLAYIANNIKK